MFASWMMARKAGLVGGPMMAANLMMAATAGQFTLGVLTLLNGVPVGMELIDLIIIDIISLMVRKLWKIKSIIRIDL